MAQGTTVDTFEKARSLASSGMVAAGVVTIVGTLLDWVTVNPPVLVPIDQVENAEPFSGLETKSAPFLLIAAGLLILCSVMLVLRGRSLWAWLGFLASMVIGGIAFQNYRGLDELWLEQMDGIGGVRPAIGLTLVVAGGIAGLIASSAGIAGAPKAPEPDPT
jgi:hypothetical protein